MISTDIVEVHVDHVRLEKPLPALEGRRVLVMLEPLEGSEMVLSPERNQELIERAPHCRRLVQQFLRRAQELRRIGAGEPRGLTNLTFAVEGVQKR